MPSALQTKIAAHLKAFRADEDGAVTTDFVVLTASVMMLGAAHARDVALGANNLAEAVEDCLVTDIAAIMEGNPRELQARLAAAEAACSSR
ncbi:hypothetical protein [Pseudooctadecabacter jejudonensis]|uniref:Uncharacterized protein n=1 Tax=Pseudooctadecabacter jejudonensis TaxID=1391910 RepID=A0A1Y5RY70_9RHOB|nr:hypothetical protein [Pseudooctadecabacter jejudonensis]SLN28099.1 hypothetical protein PSJ8397_01170 [Pseudooctadecabacter jejudonensis]